MDTKTLNKEINFTLTPEEMELSKNPESFKLYLDYKAKIQETMILDAEKQRDKEFELLKNQRDREYETLKYQREREEAAIKVMEEKRKDTLCIVLGLGAAVVESFCENYSKSQKSNIG